MVAITAATGGTFKKTTAEGQAYEVICWLANMEKDVTKNPSSLDYVSWDIDEGSNTWTGSFSIPLTIVIDTSGKSTYGANEYLTSPGFVAGSPVGTFKSTNATQYLYEVLQYLQIKENDSTSNVQGKNQVSASLNVETNVYSGTISLTVAFSLDSTNNLVITPQPYLT